MNWKEKIILDKLVQYAGDSIQNVEDLNADQMDDKNFQKFAGEMKGTLSVLSKNQSNSIYRYIDAGDGIKSKVRWFMKKAIRRMNLFYLMPYAEQQTAFNTAVTVGIEKIVKNEMILNKKVIEQEKLIEELQNEMAGLKEQNEKMNNILAKLNIK